MKKLLLILLFLILLIPQALFALSLDEAKSKGMVGETPSGYLAAITSTPEVSALLKDINGKRKAMYQDIAKKNGTQLNAVEQLAGKKAIEKTPAGQFVQDGSGKWVKK
jgi:uncharacterized protein YdbL (DUF1318 family)